MSYVVRELPREAQSKYDGVRSYTRRFQVQSTNLNDDAPAIATAIGIPTGTAYPSDSLAVLKKSNFKQTNDLCVWECQYEYDNEPNDEDKSEDNKQTPPDERNPTISYSHVDTTKHLVEDLNGDAVVSTNGEPFSDGLEIQWSQGKITIEYYTSWGSGPNAFDWINHINNAAYTLDGKTYDAKTLRVTAYNMDKTREQGAWWWKRHVELQYEEEGWNPVKKLAVGTFEIVDADDPYTEAPRLVPFTDETGNPIQQPVPLDANGRRLPQNDIPGNLHYVDFKGYYEADFSTLLLG